MTVRVLHLFSPTFGFRFSGHEKRWIWQFETWNNPEIQHLCLYPENYSIKDASAFEKPRLNKTYDRVSRILWTVKVVISILKNKNKFDVLHVHVQNWAGLLTSVLARMINKKSIYEISLMGSDNPSALRLEKVGLIKLVILRSFNKFLCTTSICKKDCLKNRILEEKIEVISNPVDLDLFRPISDENKINLRRKYNLKVDKFLILFVGSIRKRKGINLILEIFEKLSIQRSDCNLLLIGPVSSEQSSGIDDQYVKQIRERYKLQIEAETINFTGRIDSREILAEYYQAADIFIFSSTNEGLPNVILESMSSGLPTITSNLPGITDSIIINQENGFVFDQSNIDSSLFIINSLLQNLKLRKKISSSARTYVEGNHSFLVWQEKVVEFYRNLVLSH